MAGAGIAESLRQEIGPGVGDVMTPGSSAFLISRDPAARDPPRAAALPAQVPGRPGRRPAYAQDGVGDLNAIGRWVPASPTAAPAATDGRAAPRASAATWLTRPDSRDAPHLFGLGLKEHAG